ncbi:hypothetical protein BGY98DRAFT_1099618 [Russula aff. rugulosa BPL654]|nr:hypothetical protein BGY98DRAFT_1099618 [Russula aff. rugulosa BPL654]
MLKIEQSVSLHMEWPVPSALLPSIASAFGGDKGTWLVANVMHLGPASLYVEIEGIQIQACTILVEKSSYDMDRWTIFEVPTEKEIHVLRLWPSTPTQMKTCMVLKHMLTKEEKEWLREHNRWCLHLLEDLLQNDKSALKWLCCVVEHPIGVAPTEQVASSSIGGRIKIKHLYAILIGSLSLALMAPEFKPLLRYQWLCSSCKLFATMWEHQA